MSRSHRLPTALQGLLAGLVTLALGYPPAALAHWVWKDATGRVNASDLPPPSTVPDKDILKKPATSGRPTALPPASAASESTPGSAAPASVRANLDPELEKRRKALEAARAASQVTEDPALSARRRDNCQRARAVLAALESGQRMSRFNSKGEREVMDDQARSEEVQRTRQIIGTDCL